MTREEFNTKVIAQFKEFEEKEMAKSPMQMFNDAYEIAKTTALKDYLIETDDEEVENIYSYADIILGTLYAYEWNYDEEQWSSWDKISSIIDDFINENN